MELKSFIAVVRAHIKLIVACVAISTAVALGASLLLPATYQASTELVAGPALTANVTDVNQLQTAQQIAATYAAIVHTQQVAQQVVDQLGLSVTPAELLDHISVSVSADAPVMTITVTDSDASRAAAIANAVAQQLTSRAADITGSNQQLIKSIQDQIATIQTQLTSDASAISALRAKAPLSDADQATLVQLQQEVVANQTNVTTLLSTQSSMTAKPLTIIDPATVPPDKASPKLVLNVALGFTLGLVLAFVAAFAGAALDDTYKTADELRDGLNLPVLGTIGRLPETAQHSAIYRLVMLLYPRSATAEAFRTMRTNVEFADVDTGLRSLLVTSPSSGDGKSTVAANLALAFAQAGRRTILVDADLRKPSLHEMFDLTNAYGLTTLIRSETVELSQVMRKVDEPNLRILTSGPAPPNPAELLGSNRMRAITTALKAECDLVIFDTPPSAAVTDAAVLASTIDGTIVIIAAGRTRRHLAEQTDESLTRVGGRIIGAVLNRIHDRDRSGSYEVYPSEQGAVDLNPADLAHASRPAR